MLIFYFRPNFYNSSSPPSGQFQGSGCSAEDDMETGNMMSPGHSQSILAPPGSPGSMGGPALHFPGSGLPQSPPTQAPPQGFGQGIPMPPTGLQGLPPVFHQNTSPQINQQGAPFTPLAISQMPSEFFKSLFSVQPLGLAGRNETWLLYLIFFTFPFSFRKSSAIGHLSATSNT